MIIDFNVRKDLKSNATIVFLDGEYMDHKMIEIYGLVIDPAIMSEKM